MKISAYNSTPDNKEFCPPNWKQTKTNVCNCVEYWTKIELATETNVNLWLCYNKKCVKWNTIKIWHINTSKMLQYRRLEHCPHSPNERYCWLEQWLSGAGMSTLYSYFWVALSHLWFGVLGHQILIYFLEDFETSSALSVCAKLAGQHARSCDSWGNLSASAHKRVVSALQISFQFSDLVGHFCKMRTLWRAIVHQFASNWQLQFFFLFLFCFFLLLVEESCWRVIHWIKLSNVCRCRWLFRCYPGQCWRSCSWCLLVAVKSPFKRRTALVSAPWERVILMWRWSPFAVVHCSWLVFRNVHRSRWSLLDNSSLARDLVRLWTAFVFHSTSVTIFNNINFCASIRQLRL